MKTQRGSLYKKNEILTASRQKRQLMLIEGALRFAQETLQHWKNKDFEKGGQALGRCESIVSEMLQNIRRDESEVAGRVVSLYLYLSKSLSMAHFKHDESMLQEVISLLEFEQGTWNLLCQQNMRVEPPSETSTEPPIFHRVDSSTPTSVPAPSIDPTHPARDLGISFEA